MRRAHGIRGELVIEALTDGPDTVFAAGRRVFAGTRDGTLAADGREMRIGHSTPFKGGWIVGFNGIADRSAAEAWRDRYLLLPESEIAPPAEGEMFVHDLVGMRVERVDGEPVGQVTEVLDLPQGFVMEVARGRRKPVLLPFNDATVTEVDAQKRVIRVDPVDGLID